MNTEDSNTANQQDFRAMQLSQSNNIIFNQKIDDIPIMSIPFGVLWEWIPTKNRPLHLSKVLSLRQEKQYIFKAHLIEVFDNIKRFYPSLNVEIIKKLKIYQQQHEQIKDNMPPSSLRVLMCSYINVSKQGISINFDKLDHSHVAEIVEVIESQSSMRPSIEDIKEMYSILEDFRHSCNYYITLMAQEDNITYLKCIEYSILLRLQTISNRKLL